MNVSLQNFYLPHIENCSCMWYNRNHAVTLHIFSCNQETHIYIYVCVKVYRLVLHML